MVKCQVAPDRSRLLRIPGSDQLWRAGVRTQIQVQNHRNHSIVNELEYVIGPGPVKFCGPFKVKWKRKRKTMSVLWPPFPRSWKYGVIESLVVGYHPYETCLWFQDWRLFLCLPVIAHPQLEIDLKVSFWPYIFPVTWWKWGEAKYSHVITISKNNFKLNVNSEYVASAWRLVWTCTNIF